MGNQNVRRLRRRVSFGARRGLRVKVNKSRKFCEYQLESTSREYKSTSQLESPVETHSVNIGENMSVFRVEMFRVQICFERKMLAWDIKKSRKCFERKCVGDSSEYLFRANDNSGENREILDPANVGRRKYGNWST